MSIDVARLRSRFPALAHKHYLNSGSYGLLSLDVKRAFEEYLACRDERGSDWGEWAMRDDAVRTRMATLSAREAERDRHHRVCVRRHQLAGDGAGFQRSAQQGGGE